MAKKKKSVKKRDFDGESISQRYVVEQIENIPASEIEAAILDAQKDPSFVYAKQFIEGDGEYTLVVVYRRE